MRRLILILFLTATAAALAGAALSRVAHAGQGLHGGTSCTGTTACRQCVPACKATWDEKKSSKPKYSMKCEYACVRGRDGWHAGGPGCRCCPPCGDVIVKKRAYKTDGPEVVERVPKYEVQMVAATPCERGPCSRGVCWWNPLNLFRCCDWW